MAAHVVRDMLFSGKTIRPDLPEDQEVHLETIRRRGLASFGHHPKERTI